MALNELITLGIIGLVAGIIGGMTGLGGGAVVIPALVYIMGMNQHLAQGTNLLMMLPPIGIMATWSFYKAGHVNVKYAIVLMIAFVIGSYIASLFAVNIPEKIMKKIFGGFLIIVALKMIIGK